MTRYFSREPYGTVREAFEFLERRASDVEDGVTAHDGAFVGGSELRAGEFAGRAGRSHP